MTRVANTRVLLIIVFEYFRNVSTITDQYIQHRYKKALVKCIIYAFAGPPLGEGGFRMMATDYISNSQFLKLLLSLRS